MKGTITGGIVRGCNVGAIDVLDGDVRRVNLLFGDIRGGDVRGVNGEPWRQRVALHRALKRMYC